MTLHRSCSPLALLLAPPDASDTSRSVPRVPGWCAARRAATRGSSGFDRGRLRCDRAKRDRRVTECRGSLRDSRSGGRSASGRPRSTASPASSPSPPAVGEKIAGDGWIERATAVAKTQGSQRMMQWVRRGGCCDSPGEPRREAGRIGEPGGRPVLDGGAESALREPDQEAPLGVLEVVPHRRPLDREAWSARVLIGAPPPARPRPVTSRPRRRDAPCAEREKPPRIDHSRPSGRAGRAPVQRRRSNSALRPPPST